MAIHPQIEAMLREHLPADEVDSAIHFLNQSFTTNGQIVIGSVFLLAAERQIPTAKVLEVLQIEWDRNWYYQHPHLRGDTEAPDVAGVKNQTSIIDVYNALGLPHPGQESTP